MSECPVPSFTPTFANVLTVAHHLADTPLRPSWIRTHGRMQNAFSSEAFLDDLAVAANVDAVDFRLRYLNDSRGAEVLTRLRRFAKCQGCPASKTSVGNIATDR